MREIKFRVRNKNNRQLKIYNLNDTAWTCGLPENEDWENVQLYTGLKDKNGKEIYEGDVLKEMDFSLQVVWNEKLAMYRLVGGPFNLCISDKIIEIIGNIYENPELLK